VNICLVNIYSRGMMYVKPGQNNKQLPLCRMKVHPERYVLISFRTTRKRVLIIQRIAWAVCEAQSKYNAVELQSKR